jgi:PAS domain S-box-containing protein
MCAAAKLDEPSDRLRMAVNDSRRSRRRSDAREPLKPERGGRTLKLVHLSLRARLLLLVAIGIVPLLSFFLVTEYLDYREAVESTRERTLILARSMAFTLDEELQVRVAALRMLARLPALRSGDIASYRRRAEATVVDEFPGANLIVLRSDGQQLLNTLLPEGAALPIRSNLESLRQAFATGEPAISDLYQSSVGNRPVVAIDVPIKGEDGTSALALSLNPRLDDFAEALRRQRMPPSWVAAVVDRRGVIVARTRRAEQYVGRSAAPELVSRLVVQDEGAFDSTSLEGIPLLAAFSRAKRSGWAVAIGVPRKELVGPAFEAAMRTLAIGAIVLAISAALALALSRQIARPIGMLRQMAAGGLPAPGDMPTTTGLREADEVVDALRTAEEQRQLSERSFRYLFESSPLPKFVYDPATLRFVAVNDALIETYGYTREEFLAMRVIDILALEDLPGAQRFIVDPPVRQHTVDFHHRYKDGRLIDVETFSHAITFQGNPARVVVALDVTARKAAEAQLVQAQKMEAVGQLTGGLAHDFNNLLSVIIGNIGLLHEGGPTDPDFATFIAEAYAAAQRGADLTRSLLAFARRQPLRPTSLDPNELVSATTTLLRRTLGAQIEISLDLAADIWPVVVDASQLEAALINLATNARDAMSKGGRLSIATKNQQLDADYAARHAELQPGDYVLLQVSDSGTGMPPELLSKIFEPFFTTKARGQGTGLGLSMVFGFIKQSGGHINVYSEPGVGTTFRLYLPRDHAPADSVSANPAAMPRGRGETVLVVEDDAALRRVAVRQLDQLGYRVLQAENALAALKILEETGRIDLVFTDVVMAGKVDGFDLSRIVTERWPATKVILTSGFPAANAGDVAAMPDAQLLSKPYLKSDLARAVHDMLRAEAR